MASLLPAHDRRNPVTLDLRGLSRGTGYSPDTEADFAGARVWRDHLVANGSHLQFLLNEDGKAPTLSLNSDYPYALFQYSIRSAAGVMRHSNLISVGDVFLNPARDAEIAERKKYRSSAVSAPLR